MWLVPIASLRDDDDFEELRKHQQLKKKDPVWQEKYGSYRLEHLGINGDSIEAWEQLTIHPRF